MTQSSEHDLITNFVMERLRHLQSKLDQYNAELSAQNPSCPTTLALDKVDEKLKQFILSHQKQMTKRMNSDLMKFKDHVHEKELFNTLYLNRFTVAEVFKIDL
jgi:DNA-binding HxlR family transcriptional regulator